LERLRIPGPIRMGAVFERVPMLMLQ
jgi:hypothetical protein